MASEVIRIAKKDRLLSLDVLRGFDMIWIIGVDWLVEYICGIFGYTWIPMQLEHARWIGFHFNDLIFPLFMFISGAAIPYAIISKLEKNVPKRKLVIKAFKRMVILVVLGIIYNGGLKGDLTHIRFASVLSQIGIAYFFAALIVIYNSSLKSWIIWIVGILVGYAFIQLFIPVPGIGAGVLTPEGTINGYIDLLFLPGVGTYDPEGLLGISSGVGITLMGVVAGYLLRDKNRNDWQKVYLLAAVGVVLIILAQIIHPFYPMIKKCWTTTFNLMAGGMSFLLMAFFFMIVDILKWQKWTFYFRVIGMNSIFIYLLKRFVDLEATSSYFFGWAQIVPGIMSELITILGFLITSWILLYYMYKKEIFLRV